jgi:hypothetical protein
MAKIRSKQLADFVNSYASVTALTDILSAAAVSTEISNAGTALTGAIDDSITSLETLTGTLATQTSIDTRVSSIETLNTEQNDSITSLETLTGTLATQTSIDTRVSSIETLNTEQNDSITSLETLTGTLATQTSIDTRVSSIESINTTQGTAITSLEAAILEDFEMFSEILPGISTAAGAPGAYTLLFPATPVPGTSTLQDNNKYLVQAYVNGVLVEVQSATASTVTIVADYAVDTSDVVTFVYQIA